MSLSHHHMKKTRTIPSSLNIVTGTVISILQHSQKDQEKRNAAKRNFLYYYKCEMSNVTTSENPDKLDVFANETSWSSRRWRTDGLGTKCTHKSLKRTTCHARNARKYIKTEIRTAQAGADFLRLPWDLHTVRSFSRTTGNTQRIHTGWQPNDSFIIASNGACTIQGKRKLNPFTIIALLYVEAIDKLIIRTAV